MSGGPENRPEEAERRIQVSERRETPPLSLALGYLAVLPFAGAALLVWLAPEARPLVVNLTVLWGAAILIFLSGVRRGLSFRTPGGPRMVQIGMAGWLFLLGLAALVVPLELALGALLAGYLTLATLDPLAARREEAPLFFASFRPVQMGLAVVSLAAVLASVLL